MTSEHIQTLIDNFGQKLKAQVTEMEGHLHGGDLREFENQLSRQTDALYNELAHALIEEVAQKPETEEKARKLAQKKGSVRFAKPR